MSQQTQQAVPRFLRLEEVSDLTKLGKSTILSWETQGKFPRAVRPSANFRVWLESDVHSWILGKHAERDPAFSLVEA